MKFKESFDGYVCDGDAITTKVGKFTVTARIVRDEHMGAPWEEHDGHGPVSEWTDRAKRPGERVLNEDRGSKRYYDFQEAVKIARRDGWGWIPHKLTIERDGETYPCGGRATAGPFTAHDAEDFNRAIHSVYKQHRETMTAGQYAAHAAERDYQAMRAWCRDEWWWGGVVLSVEKAGVVLDDHAASLWGIECNYPESDNSYLTEVANELLPEAIEAGKAVMEKLSE